MPTIRDVAAAAGVSVTTVSRVLNGKDDVSPETVAHVQQVIAKLGYVASLAAHSMRSRRTWVIGIVTAHFDHSWAIEVLKAASRAVQDTEYDLFAMTSNTRNDVELGRWEQQQITRLNGTLTDGMLAVVPISSEIRTDYPLVSIDPDRASEAHPAVFVDNYGADTLMNYLLSLGHRRIAFICGYPHIESARIRLQCYANALASVGVPYAPELVVQGNYSMRQAEQETHRLLALPNRPTAIFAANDDMAIGAMGAAHAAGLRVPVDLSVAGFDNIPQASFANPSLTTMDQNIDLMVRTAVQMLINQIEGRPLERRHVTVPARLILRQSCAPPPAALRP